MRLGEAVAVNNGYSIHKLFVLDVDGKYVFVGYGVFSPDGELLQSFSTPDAAHNYLNDVASTHTSALKP